MSNKTWQALEDYVKQLISYDKPTRIPLSGGTKGEEDVVGIHLVSQCKFTADKNISILAKDLERLISAANLLHKFPLFFNESQAGKTVAVPIIKETEFIIEQMLTLATVLQGINELRLMLSTLKTVEDLHRADKELARLTKLMDGIKFYINVSLLHINNALDAKRNNLLSYNLFEQENTNGT